MDTLKLFQAALALEQPWQIKNVEFKEVEGQRELHIQIDFHRGATFSSVCCGHSGCKAYDTEERTWRHLNFFQHKTYITARVPRVECGKCGSIRTITVPWAEKDSRFTLLFEAYVMVLVREMPVLAVADLVDEHDTRLWRILHRHVEEARAKADYSDVTQVGLDETASKRGHNYITLFMDLTKRRLLFATEGRDSSVIGTFATDFMAHNGDPDKVADVTCDLSPAFIAGVRQHMKNAEIIFDRFHVMQLVSKAVDEVRRQEVKTNEVLKNTRYIWLKNPSNLTAKQRETLATVSKLHTKTGKAYQLRLALADFFDMTDIAAAENYLQEWYFWATHSKLDPIIKAAKTVKDHWNGIVAWHRKRISNAILEGTNSLIQAARAKARGYRSTHNFITIAYLIAGKLEFSLPM